MHLEEDGPNLQSIDENLELCKSGDWQGKITGLNALELIVGKNKRHATESLLNGVLPFLKPGEDDAVKEAAAQLVSVILNKNPRLVASFIKASSQIDGNSRQQVMKLLDTRAMEKYVMAGLGASNSGAKGCCFGPVNREDADRAQRASLAILNMRNAKKEGKKERPVPKNRQPR